MPWVLSDYSSATPPLQNPAAYRDLAKPVGAQTEKLADFYRARYDAWASGGEGGVPAFHYGAHYSAAGYVCYFLARVEPFTSLALALQDGRFDCPDRLFASLQDTWSQCVNV
jgi:hypothetical protein